MLGMIAGAAGSIFGASRAAAEARKQERLLDESAKDNEQWYNRRYNEDATQRSESQAYINQMRSALGERSRAARGGQAVGGATGESVALQKQANTQAMGGVISNLASAATQRRDAIEDRYNARKAAITDARINVSKQKAQNIQQAASGLTGVVSQGLGGMNLFDKKQ